jgi:hypothetical protein
VALAVGVERGIEAAVGRAHLAQQPVDDAPGGVRKQRLAGQRPGVGVELQERPVVVEHLLEMRDRPALVDRIAAEAAAQLVAHAPARHLAQGEQRHVARLRGTGPLRLAHQEEQLARARELGRRGKPAPHRVEGLRQGVNRRGERGVAELGLSS